MTVADLTIAALAALTLGLLVHLPCASAAPQAAGPAEEDVFWHDVTLYLPGALPNTHERLSDHMELYLGRLEGPAGAKWRKYVLGFSALFNPRDLRSGDHKHYNWMDHQGTLLEVGEQGDDIRLVVDMTITPDPWVCGGKARLDIRLKREGDKLTGSYSGNFDKAVEDRAGPAGDKPTSGKVTGTIRRDLWPSPAAGHVPLQKGEHPRLMFRKHDLPGLKKRMETPEGKVILERLQEALARENPKEQLWHGYGYGLMYQLTGDRKWAEIARDYAEGTIAGKITSPRYGWYTRDGGYMRVGPSAAATAAAYDMCYDAWDEQFRQHVARKIQDRICPNFIDKPNLNETNGQFNQRSNHYMLYNGGGGMSVLAIRGDPGTDDEVTGRAHRIFLQRLKRGLVDGFGDHGWFYEGTFCGRFPTNGALSQYIQALRVAEGRDYVTGCSEAQWLCTKWIYEVVRSGGKIECVQRGMYNNIKWDRPGGDFSQGFGILPEDHKPAVLWAFQKVFEPDKRTYDSSGPKQAAYAFVNWPIGLEPKDPAKVLGHFLFDREANFFVFRSSWQGEGDVMVSMWANAAVVGMGLRGVLPVSIPPSADVLHYHESAARDVAVISARSGGAMPGTAGLYAMAVDFTGLSGAPVLVAGAIVQDKPAGEADSAGAAEAEQARIRAMLARSAGQGQAAAAPRPAPADKPAISNSQVRLGGVSVAITTVQKGPAPEARVVGEGDDRKIVIGRRTIAFDGEKFVLGE